MTRPVLGCVLTHDVLARVIRSKRIDIVHDRDHLQHDPPDDVRSLDVIGVNRGVASTASGKAAREVIVVELDAIRGEVARATRLCGLRR